MHRCTLGGRDYWFRAPTIYDPAEVRRVLTRRRVRSPAGHEFHVCARGGIAALAEETGEREEGDRQIALVDEWYEKIVPTDEDDIDEPDFELRAAEVRRLETERLTWVAENQPSIAAIMATLERHWPPFAELKADQQYWDDISRIEIVRLLLVRIGERPAERGDDGLLTEAAYRAIPAKHRLQLATFAFGLMAPDGEQAKN